jgi:hypothetical protein
MVVLEWAPSDDTLRASPYFGWSQTGGDCLVAGSARVWRDPSRRAVIGRAKDDGLVSAHGGQVQERTGAREQEKRASIGSAATQMSNHGVLCR